MSVEASPIRSSLRPSPGRSLEPASASQRPAHQHSVPVGHMFAEGAPAKKTYRTSSVTTARYTLIITIRSSTVIPTLWLMCPLGLGAHAPHPGRAAFNAWSANQRAGCEPSASWAGKLTLERCVCGVPAMVTATAPDRQALAHTWPLCARASRPRAGWGRPLRRVPSALAHAWSTALTR
jgi:hypothetical protein